MDAARFRQQQQRSAEICRHLEGLVKDSLSAVGASRQRRLATARLVAGMRRAPTFPVKP
jgi:hypothetical protein